MGFFPEGVTQPYNPLRGAVALLSPKAKQAMYAASKTGMIARGTWNGCAFNKAGSVLGFGVASSDVAAQVFEMSEHDVDRFIRAWDSVDCNDTEANRYLIEALESVGTHTPINAGRGRRIIRGYAYKSEATKFAEQLESGELTVDMIPGCDLVAELLSA